MNLMLVLIVVVLHRVFVVHEFVAIKKVKMFMLIESICIDELINLTNVCLSDVKCGLNKEKHAIAIERY